MFWSAADYHARRKRKRRRRRFMGFSVKPRWIPDRRLFDEDTRPAFGSSANLYDEPGWDGDDEFGEDAPEG